MPVAREKSALDTHTHGYVMDKTGRSAPNICSA